ncbi:MAG: hypothetical protein ACOH5I_02060 [Oligoflexus sp.]
MAIYQQRKWIFATFLVIFAAITACKSSELRPGYVSPESSDSESGSKLSKAQPRPSEDNGGLPGYPLVCQIEDRKIDSLNLDCQMLAEDGQSLQIEENFSDWQFDFQSASPDIAIETRPTPGAWHASWKISYLAGIDINWALDQSVVHFAGKSKNSSQAPTIDLSWRVTEALPPYWEQRHSQRFRLVIHSIETTDFIDPSACVTYLQFSAKKQWLEPSYDEATDTMFFGEYPATVNSSSNPQWAWEAFFPQGFWESNLNTYHHEAPFDTRNNDPSWVEINFGDTLIAVDGIRLQGTPLDFYAAGECSPDQISLLQSKDGANWQVIPAVNRLPVQTVAAFVKSW